MMMSGSWRRKRPQRLAEGHAHRLVDGHLHDALDVVFDRVLGGQQFGINRVDAAQAGIQRRGLAATGRAGDNENAVGPQDHLGHVIMDVFGKTERFDVQADRPAVQHAQHDRFAKLRRQRGHAQVDLPVAHREIDAPVLRQAPFGNVQVRT
jgi:hypothetical protein